MTHSPWDVDGIEICEITPRTGGEFVRFQLVGIAAEHWAHGIDHDIIDPDYFGDGSTVLLWVKGVGHWLTERLPL